MEENWQEIDRPIREYPIGTTLHCTNGGFYTRSVRGWHWLGMKNEVYGTVGDDTKWAELPTAMT